MELRVLGCHGGETPQHRTTAFLIDERLTLDAGALTSQLTLEDQARIEVVLVSHSHMCETWRPSPTIVPKSVPRR